MLTLATAAIFVTVIIVNYKRKEKDVTIDLSLMLPAMLGDVIIACVLF